MCLALFIICFQELGLEKDDKDDLVAKYTQKLREIEGRLPADAGEPGQFVLLVCCNLLVLAPQFCPPFP